MSEPHDGETSNMPPIQSRDRLAAHPNGSNSTNCAANDRDVLPSTSAHSQQQLDTANPVKHTKHRRSNNSTENPLTNGDLIDLYDHATENYESGGGEGALAHLVEAINEQLLYDLNRKVRQSEDVAIGSDEQRNETKSGDLNTLGASRPFSLQPMEQHQTAIREFKRLGAYCTLRPDQRRKHLLKVLPNLRKSMLLQTLLAANFEQTSVAESNANKSDSARKNNTNTTTTTSSNNNNNNNNSNDQGWPYNDVDSLLIELDDFLIDRNAMAQYGPKADNCTANKSTQLQRNDIGSNVCPNNGNGTATQNNADKVEDCLLELDAYLEEIDREYAWACTGTAHNRVLSSIANVQDSRAVYQSNGGSTGREDDRLTLSAAAAGRFQRSNCDVCTTSDNDYDDSDYSCDECAGNIRDTSGERRRSCHRHSHCRPLRRGYKLRRTIAAFDTCDKLHKPNNSALSANGGQRLRRSKHESSALSWRRQSMRKTCPIDMPEQNVQDIDHVADTEPIVGPIAYNDINDNYDMLVVGRPVDGNGNETNDLDSLNSEILTTIVAGQLYTADAPFGRSMADNGLADAIEETRPRQLGRRSEAHSRVVSITAERSSEGNQRIIVNCDTGSAYGRPSDSANSSYTLNQSLQQTPLHQQHLQNQFMVSEPSSGASSRYPSPVSLGSSSESSSGASTSAGEINMPSNEMDAVPAGHAFNASASSDNNMSNSNDTNTNSGITSTTTSTGNNNRNAQHGTNPTSNVWPFEVSRIFAAVCCTLGLFNLSRFSMFSILFGANFIVQFVILSVLFGIPMLWLQICLGTCIKGGPISMWRASPICKGIGIALVLVQALTTIYSSVSIAWLLFYIRDACVSTRYPFYRWQEIFEFFRGPSDNGIAVVSNASEPSAASAKLGETVADYFNGIILQRYQLGPGGRIASGTGIGAVRFQLAFNLTIVWLIVFVVHCKGIRLYGRFVVAMVILPMIALLTLTVKMLTLLNLSALQNIFPATDWQDFFVNSQSWLSAAQETFLTWSLLGASIVSIFSKAAGNHQNAASSTALRRDACSIAAITMVGLLVAAVFGNACVQILIDRGFFYFPGSFETTSSSVFLLSSTKPMPPQLATSLSKWLPRYSTFLGESFKRIDPNVSAESGWQPVRLIVEILPATLAAATLDNISSIWSLLAFLLFTVFAIAQMCIMWMPIANALSTYSESIPATSTTVLLTCLAGLLLGIPLTTESGINIIYFMDSVIGGAWFVLLLWTGQIFAVFLVRGRPYSGDMLVNDLRLGQTLSAFIAFSWNLLIPIGLMTLCVLQYKISYSYDFYHWSAAIAQSYWPVWARKAAAFIQIGIFQIIPITAIVQTYRYLSKGPPDILDRFQLLYRPSICSGHISHRYPVSRRARSSNTNRPMNNTDDLSAIPAIAVSLDSNPVSLVLEDAPPKYTPPPSYTTATGARIAKLLRNSIRRSVRRLLGEQNTVRRQRIPLQTNASDCTVGHCQNPPEYTTIVTTESSQPLANQTAPIYSLQPDSLSAVDVQNNNNDSEHNCGAAILQDRPVNRRYTATNFPCQKPVQKIDSFSSTMPRRQAASDRHSILSDRADFRNLTAHDVAQLLRSTHRTAPNVSVATTVALRPHTLHTIDSIGTDQEDFSLTRSVEELVLNEVPPNRASYIEPITESTIYCDKPN